MVQWTLWNTTLVQLRTLVGIILGSVVILHETFLQVEPRLYVLLTGLACLAGTFGALADEWRRK